MDGGIEEMGFSKGVVAFSHYRSERKRVKRRATE